MFESGSASSQGVELLELAARDVVLLLGSGGILGIELADGSVRGAADRVALLDEGFRGERGSGLACGAGFFAGGGRSGLVISAAALYQQHEDDEKGHKATQRHEAPAHIDVHLSHLPIHRKASVHRIPAFSCADAGTQNGCLIGLRGFLRRRWPFRPPYVSVCEWQLGHNISRF